MSNQNANPGEGDQNSMLEVKTRTRTKTKVALIAFLIAAAAIGLSAGTIRVFRLKLPFNIETIKKAGEVLPPPSGPDLVVTAFSKNGSNYNITFQNIGNAPVQVPPLFSVSIYRERIGTDETYNPQSSATPMFENAEWKFITGGTWTNTVPPGGQQTVTYTSTVSPPTGSNKARAVVDSTNTIAETNENNNVSVEINL